MIDTLKLKVEKLSLSETGAFTANLLDYLDQNPKLEKFVGSYPSIESFDAAIQNRQFPPESRRSLVKVLNQQYSGLVLSGKLIKNITALKNDQSFTVTTGHQLNIFTGPLFFIYKIVSTIRVCQILKEHYPAYDFVPVYWMASEDHDYAEINHFNLFGKEYRWDCPQHGAVGHFQLDGLSGIIEQIRDCPDFFEDAYLNSSNLAEATRKIVNHLFGDYGLIVLDPDHPDLKSTFSPLMKDELLQQNTFQQVSASTEDIANNGYKTLVSPREINLFYLKEQLRERIVRAEGKYEVLGTDISFTEQQLLDELDQHPERFSPNVIMRTVYQETILPNLAYIGGPGELTYWMQFKSVFDHYQIPFPILIPRNNALVISKSLAKKIDKLELKVADLFLSDQELKSKFIEKNSNATLDLQAEQQQLKLVFEQIHDKIKAIDGSLTGYIKAEENKALKNLHQIEKRLKKAEEQNQEIAVNQLLGVKEKLFPDGNLQERHQNFLNFYINNPQFIEDLMEHLDPFDFSFYVLFENG
ncbi:MAG: putative cysteine ligase BshC [Cyclobacteriaceae bacterium]|nr:MAG: putative cysteine ligase BshC [Cyclobacteriaceae bacterium]